MKFKIYYTETTTHAVEIEAKTANEAEDKFWIDDYSDKAIETVMTGDCPFKVEEIHIEGELVKDYEATTKSEAIK